MITVSSKNSNEQISVINDMTVESDIKASEVNYIAPSNELDISKIKIIGLSDNGEKVASVTLNAAAKSLIGQSVVHTVKLLFDAQAAKK